MTGFVWQNSLYPFNTPMPATIGWRIAPTAVAPLGCRVAADARLTLRFVDEGGKGRLNKEFRGKITPPMY